VRGCSWSGDAPKRSSPRTAEEGVWSASQIDGEGRSPAKVGVVEQHPTKEVGDGGAWIRRG
jgi:hypothetical protein